MARELRKPATTLNHLSFIYDAYVNPQYDIIDVFTLNHDCLIEKYLRSRGVIPVDGFGEPDPKVRYWNPGVFQNKESKINLFKLHGSVDWYRLRPWGYGWEQEAIGILPEGADPSRLHLDRVDGGPRILIGTFNKMLEYTGGVFLDLLWQFRHRLRLTTDLAVCGYGFADKGINTQLVEWIYSNSANRICVVHPQPVSLGNSARGAIKNKWEDWEKDRRLIVVPKRVECVTFEEIREALAHRSAS
ncbi:MAG: SIR2 family protein [Deltaproteobacteria bacterium]|nr:SIR2 family protein [Deltaproteobacteria bacterium]